MNSDLFCWCTPSLRKVIADSPDLGALKEEETAATATVLE